MAQGRLVIAPALALVLGCASMLAYFWTTDRSVPGEIAGLILNAHPDRTFNTETLIFRQSRGDISGLDLGAVRQATSYAPLEEDIFVFAGARLVVEAQHNNAETLLGIATRRNPRSREARLLLADLLVRRGDTRNAVNHIEALYRLEPGQRSTLQGILSYLASVPATRAATLEALTEPSLKLHILRSQARNGASASMLLDAAERMIDFDLGEDRAPLVAAITTPLLNDGDWEGARRLWTNFYPDALSGDDMMIDPGFSGDYPAPFGWLIGSDRAGYARVSDLGLEGEYYGRRRAVLARQAVIAAPGRYRLVVTAATTGPGLRAELACRGREKIGEVGLSGARTEFFFVVPTGCTALDVMLVGGPLDPPIANSFEIREIRIESDS